MTKWIMLYILLAISISACGQSPISPVQSDPSNNIVTTVNQDDEKERRQTIGSEGGILKFGPNRVVVAPNVLSQPAWFEVSKVPEKKQRLEIPSVNGVNSRYLMGSINHRKLLGAYRLRTNGSFQGGVELIIKSDKNDKGEKSEDKKASLEEVFVRDEFSGNVETAGLTYGSDEFRVPLGRVDSSVRESEQSFFVYRVKRSDYTSACQYNGGDDTNGYCSFANKVFPTLIGPRAISKTFRFLTWNIGNVDGTCGPVPPIPTLNGDWKYRFKQCYISAERKTIDSIVTYEQETTTLPGLIYLQEVFHGDCRGVTDLVIGRICGSPAGQNKNIHPITRILGTYGNKYTYRCTDRIYPGNNIGTNTYDGYECVALNPTFFSFADTTTGALRVSCSLDTGFQMLDVRQVSANTLMRLINAHTATDQNCIKSQLDDLATRLGVPSSSKLLWAGDFNIDINRQASDPGTLRYQSLTAPFGTTNAAKLANQLDNHGEDTAFYFGVNPVGGNKAFDHVLSNFMTGTCTRRAEVQGMDHRGTACVLTGSF